MSDPQEKEDEKKIWIQSPQHYHTIIMSVVVEGGLAVLAFVIGYFIHFSPVRTLKWSITDVIWGLTATIPMLVLYVFMDRSHAEPFRKIRNLVQFFVDTFLSRCSTLQVILICALAGIGEELFFRGILHDAIAYKIGGTTGLIIGILISAFFFGISHAATFTYCILAFFISLYFSWLLIFFDNILVPITTHAVYDYCVIHYLLQRRQKQLRKMQEEEEQREA